MKRFGITCVMIFAIFFEAAPRAFDHVLNLALIRHDLPGKRPMYNDKELLNLEKQVVWVFGLADVKVHFSEHAATRIYLQSMPLRECKSEQDQVENFILACALVDPDTKLGSVGYIDVWALRNIELSKGAPYSDRLMAKAIAHEVGHLFGLKHLEGGANGIMTAQARWWDPNAFQYWNEVEVQHLLQQVPVDTSVHTTG